MNGTAFTIESHKGSANGRQLAGAPNLRVWTISANQDAVAGTQEVFHASYRRPWETGIPALKEITFTLTVV